MNELRLSLHSLLLVRFVAGYRCTGCLVACSLSASASVRNRTKPGKYRRTECASASSCCFHCWHYGRLRRPWPFLLETRAYIQETDCKATGHSAWESSHAMPTMLAPLHPLAAAVKHIPTAAIVARTSRCCRAAIELHIGLSEQESP